MNRTLIALMFLAATTAAHAAPMVIDKDNLDSWDVIGPYDSLTVEVENHFDVPIKGKKK